MRVWRVLLVGFVLAGLVWVGQTAAETWATSLVCPTPDQHTATACSADRADLLSRLKTPIR